MFTRRRHDQHRQGAEILTVTVMPIIATLVGFVCIFQQVSKRVVCVEQRFAKCQKQYVAILCFAGFVPTKLFQRTTRCRVTSRNWQVCRAMGGLPVSRVFPCVKCQQTCWSKICYVLENAYSRKEKRNANCGLGSGRPRAAERSLYRHPLELGVI